MVVSRGDTARTQHRAIQSGADGAGQRDLHEHRAAMREVPGSTALSCARAGAAKRIAKTAEEGAIRRSNGNRRRRASRRQGAAAAMLARRAVGRPLGLSAVCFCSTEAACGRHCGRRCELDWGRNHCRRKVCLDQARRDAIPHYSALLRSTLRWPSVAARFQVAAAVVLSGRTCCIAANDDRPKNQPACR